MVSGLMHGLRQRVTESETDTKLHSLKGVKKNRCASLSQISFTQNKVFSLNKKKITQQTKAMDITEEQCSSYW